MELPEISNEVGDFLRRQPQTWGYARLAEACAGRFGEAAPDAEAIRTWWLTNAGPQPDPREIIPRDAEVAAFIRDLAGRLPPQLIFNKLRDQFPARRVPGRSTFYRHISALLTKDALEGP